MSPILKYRDPGSGNYLTPQNVSGNNWATINDVDTNVINAKDYTDTSHPKFIGGCGFDTDTVLTLGSLFVIPWETFSVPTTPPNNICTAGDLSSKGLLLTKPWLYLYRFRVTFKTFSQAGMSVYIYSSGYVEDGSTISGVSANEYHISTTAASHTSEIVSVFDINDTNAPYRATGQVRSYVGTCTLDSATLYVWGPIC